MKNFAIFLKEMDTNVIKRIEENYPNYYKLSDTAFLVSSDRLSQDIAENVGIKRENSAENSLGVVFRLSSAFSGYFERSLWEWLEQWEK